jgi:hypothetical protein
VYVSHAVRTAKTCLVGLFVGLFGGVLEVKGLGLELLSVFNGVTDIDVVEEDVVLHGPDLETNLSGVSSGMIEEGDSCVAKEVGNKTVKALATKSRLKPCKTGLK